jgi:membrane protein implicated in regulation of membrane protease activity
MTEWFNSLELFEKIYWMIAIPSSLVFIFIMISSFLGGDADGDADVEADGNETGEIGFQFFTFKNLVGFFTIFSWIGIGCIRSGYSNTATIVVSMICGLLMMTAMAALFYFMTKLVEDGTMRLSNAIGRTGQVYLPIKGKKGGFGKVQITIQGSLHEIQALTNDSEELSVGTIVQVEEVIDGNILLVTSKLS